MQVQGTSCAPSSCSRVMPIGASRAARSRMLASAASGPSSKAGFSGIVARTASSRLPRVRGVRSIDSRGVMRPFDIRGDIAVMADFIFACGSRSSPSQVGHCLQDPILYCIRVDSESALVSTSSCHLTLIMLKVLEHTCV